MTFAYNLSALFLSALTAAPTAHDSSASAWASAARLFSAAFLLVQSGWPAHALGTRCSSSFGLSTKKPLPARL